MDSHKVKEIIDNLKNINESIYINPTIKTFQDFKQDVMEAALAQTDKNTLKNYQKKMLNFYYI
jgi:hypothetical protein